MLYKTMIDIMIVTNSKLGHFHHRLMLQNYVNRIIIHNIAFSVHTLNCYFICNLGHTRFQEGVYGKVHAINDVELMLVGG